MKLRVYLVEDSSIMNPVLRTLIEAIGAKVVGNSGYASPAAVPASDGPLAACASV